MDNYSGRRCAAVVLIALAAVLGPAGTAMAGQDTIVNGNLYPWAQYGPRHSLSSVWTTWFSGDLACANALNDDGSGWAGGSVCASWADTNKGHLYCACQYRKGAGFTAGGYGTAYVRQFW